MKNIDIDELREHKNSLESVIARFVVEELRHFTNTTGVDISNIHIQPEYSYTLGSKKPQIYNIRIDVKLDI